ncbi:hypothetical protein [Rouxiella badensis]|uniref:hypothetical protein n=1 Tax=Rouxiella badensis TaxID=1646377 RepID=UPI003C66C972
MTRYQQDFLDSLPESSRPKYLATIEKQARRNALMNAIAGDAIAAMECGRRGEQHWRLNQMRVNAMNKEAAFYPACPTHLLPEGKRLLNQSTDMQDAYLDYDTPHYGPGGAVRQG